MFTMVSLVPYDTVYYQPQIDAWTFWLGVVRPYEAGVGIMPLRFNITPTKWVRKTVCPCCFPAKKIVVWGKWHDNPPIAICHAVPAFFWFVCCNQFRKKKTNGAACLNARSSAASPHLLGGERDAQAWPIITWLQDPAQRSQEEFSSGESRGKPYHFEGRNSLITPGKSPNPKSRFFFGFGWCYCCGFPGLDKAWQSRHWMAETQKKRRFVKVSSLTLPLNLKDLNQLSKKELGDPHFE